jgi:hypothetical protein
MPRFRSIALGAALLGLGQLLAACRSESADGSKKATSNAARGASAAVSTSSTSTSNSPAPGAAATGDSAPVALAAPLAKSLDAGCGAAPAPGTPLPKLEQKKLAAKREGRYRFELQYPVLVEADSKMEQQLNRLLSQRLTAIQKRFVDESSGDESAPSDPDDARWFEGKCEVAYHSSAFVSVACDTMEGPGAHPNLDKFAYNFQTCPEVRLLTLVDLCRSLSACRQRIVELLNEDFRTGDKKQTGIQFRDSASSGPSDPEHPVAKLDSIGLTPTGLRVFLFDELPHVLQAFAIVDLPAVELSNVLRADIAHAIWTF